MIFLSLASTVLLIAVDRWSKFLAGRYLIGKGTVVVIPHFLGLKYIQNTGAAFSILSGKTDFLIVVTTIALVIMAYAIFIKSYGTVFEKICFILIFSGGIGNLIDRVFRGYVVDYFELLFMDFAIFNVADVYVCTGLALYASYVFYTEYLLKKREDKSE